MFRWGLCEAEAAKLLGQADTALTVRLASPDELYTLAQTSAHGVVHACVRALRFTDRRGQKDGEYEDRRHSTGTGYEIPKVLSYGGRVRTA